MPLLDAPLLAQRGRGYNPGFRVDPVIEKIPYDGRFTLVRLSFTTNGPAGFYYRGLPAWAHGYPNWTNLMRIVSEISALHPLLYKSTVMAPDDPQLFKYPVAYMAEADFWGMSDKEAGCLRAYLKKGGFIIFDDFRDDFRDGYQGWATFTQQMKRVLPEGRVVDLTPANPIFHSFFDINSVPDIVLQDYDRGRPIFRGIYEIRVLRRSVYVVLDHPNFERPARRSREQDQSRNRQNHAHDRNHRRIVENPVGRRSVRNAGKAGQPSEVVDRPHQRRRHGARPRRQSGVLAVVGVVAFVGVPLSFEWLAVVRYGRHFADNVPIN